MEEDYYIALLEKQLSGDISRAERKTLSSWRKASATNERTAKSVELVWRATAPRPPAADPDTDAAFAALEDRIAAADAAAGASSAKVVPLPRRSRWWVAAAAVLLVLTLGGYLLRDSDLRGGSTPVYTKVESGNATRLISLADGTQVHLNANSRLRYPATFDSDERRVILEGEAFFDVRRREDQAFVVSTERGEIRVLGTSFNVRAYADQPATEVFVATGRVQVSAKDGDDKVILNENESALINHSDATLRKKTDASPNAMSWYSGELVFEQTLVRTALEQIENEFGLRFQLDGQISSCPLDLTFDRDKAERFINDLETIFGARIERNAEGVYVVSGGGC